MLRISRNKAWKKLFHATKLNEYRLSVALIVNVTVNNSSVRESLKRTAFVSMQLAYRTLTLKALEA